MSNVLVPTQFFGINRLSANFINFFACSLLNNSGAIAKVTKILGLNCASCLKSLSSEI